MSNQIADWRSNWKTWIEWLGNQSQLKWSHRLGLMAVGVLVGFTCGASLATIMASTPLKNRAAVSAPKVSSLGKVPFVLTNPINVLILGIDNVGHFQTDDPTSEAALSGNSDVMLLVRLQPDGHQINVLSIPRDTRVDLPDSGADKINAANAWGGVALSAQVVSQMLGGVAIDRYIRLDTEGFVHLVDALGGVEINVPKEMHYTDQTQKLQVDFAAGWQKLSGQHLEEYVRFRHDELGDIGRVQRQQDVLKALLNQLLKPETLGKLPAILQVVQTNFDTNLSVSDLLAVGQFLRQADLHQTNLVTLPGRFSRKDEYRLSYWIGDPEATAAILARYFDVPNPDRPDETETALNPDEIRVAVVNLTDQPDLAAAAAALLRDRGFSQAYISDDPIGLSTNSTATTAIIAQAGNPDSAELVQQAIGMGQVEVESIGDLAADVTLIVGTDLAATLFP